MQIDLLCEYASSLAGQPAAGIVKQLYTKKKVNEFLIAKKLNLTINQTRNLLYKLADDGLVSFIRKKDKKKGGWYTYFWSLEIGRGLQKLYELLFGKVAHLKERIENRKTNRFYFCASCDAEFNEEGALTNDYHCGECGELLNLKDPTEEVGRIEKELKQLDKQLKEVSDELGEWQKKEDKQRMRKARVEEKKKQDARKAKSREKKRIAQIKPAKARKIKKKIIKKKITKKRIVKKKSLFKKLLGSHKKRR